MSVWAGSSNSEFIKRQTKKEKEAEVKRISITSSPAALEQLHTVTSHNNPVNYWDMEAVWHPRFHCLFSPSCFLLLWYKVKPRTKWNFNKSCKMFLSINNIFEISKQPVRSSEGNKKGWNWCNYTQFVLSRRSPCVVASSIHYSSRHKNVTIVLVCQEIPQVPWHTRQHWHREDCGITRSCVADSTGTVLRRHYTTQLHGHWQLTSAREFTDII